MAAGIRHQCGIEVPSWWLCPRGAVFLSRWKNIDKVCLSLNVQYGGGLTNRDGLSLEKMLLHLETCGNGWHSQVAGGSAQLKTPFFEPSHSFGLYTVSKMDSPAVDNNFLPTIDYVAGTFHAVAPQPMPVLATTFMHMQTPLAAESTSTVLKTVFVQQAGHEPMSRPEAATITGINHGQRSFTIFQYPSDSSRRGHHSGHSSQYNALPYGFASTLEQRSRIIYEASYTIFL